MPNDSVLSLMMKRQVALVCLASCMARRLHLDSALLSSAASGLNALSLVLVLIGAPTACVPANLFCNWLEQLTI